MTAALKRVTIRFWIRQSVRYLLVSSGFRLLQAALILGVLAFLLSGDRIRTIDQLGNRADIVAAILATVSIRFFLTLLNRRVMNSIDRHFFREAYDAQQILSELGQSIRMLTKSNQAFELAAAKIDEALHPVNLTILVADDSSRAYIPAFSLKSDSDGPSLGARAAEVRFSYDDSLITFLRSRSEVSTIDLLSDQVPRGPLLTPYEQENFGKIKAALLIPISSKSTLQGLLLLGSRRSDLPYGPEDKSLLLIVANQIAVFLENMQMVDRLAEERRAAQELELASEVQRHLFPRAGLESRKLEIFGTCLPARGIGGDYYDYFEMDANRIGIAIADVAGKGIAAALLMSTVQASLRCQPTSAKKPLVDVVSSMNRMLRRATSNRDYATFFFGEFDADKSRLTYVNAGHNPPILIRSAIHQNGNGPEMAFAMAGMDGGPYAARAFVETSQVSPPVQLLTTGGPVIGTFLDVAYEQESIALKSGDTLIIYTDGVTEALNPEGAEFGEGKLRRAAFESLAQSAEHMVDHIIGRVLQWQLSLPQHDDITLIVLKVK
ncbi:MAG TPA: GAF domain-containing SpoIIE family protein phosphatase [Pyrinomonadaceae bacterium]|nr:GAF domain-containing SpoIIE family protein phosphatase [Pyrinomonadaceae bacterium]